MHQQLSRKSAQQGVVLLEAMIAILLFSIGVLAIVGLQAAMVKNTADAKYRAEASHIAQKRVGEMWAADLTNATILASYIETDANISGMLPGGKRTVAQIVPGQFRVTVKWLQPGAGETEHNFTTIAVINGN